MLIVKSMVKKLVKEHGMRTSADFIYNLNILVHDRVMLAIKNNGGRKTLTASELQLKGIKPRGK